MTKAINVALIGSKFMGRAHSNAWLKVAKFFPVDPQPMMHTVVGRNASELESFAQTWGWQHSSTDLETVLRSPEIGLVDIATPNDVHAEQAIAMLEAGKHVACEKPLAGTFADARAMAGGRDGARRAKTFVWFNYRRVPAIGLARRLVGDRRAGAHPTTSRALPAELGREDTPAVVALRGRRRRFRSPRRSQRAHHRHGPLRDR